MKVRISQSLLNGLFSNLIIPAFVQGPFLQFLHSFILFRELSKFFIHAFSTPMGGYLKVGISHPESKSIYEVGYNEQLFFLLISEFHFYDQPINLPRTVFES